MGFLPSLSGDTVHPLASVLEGARLLCQICDERSGFLLLPAKPLDIPPRQQPMVQLLKMNHHPQAPPSS